jgi:hypothetical protein
MNPPIESSDPSQGSSAMTDDSDRRKRRWKWIQIGICSGSVFLILLGLFIALWISALGLGGGTGTGQGGEAGELAMGGENPLEGRRNRGKGGKGPGGGGGENKTGDVKKQVPEEKPEGGENEEPIPDDGEGKEGEEPSPDDDEEGANTPVKHDAIGITLEQPKPEEEKEVAKKRPGKRKARLRLGVDKTVAGRGDSDLCRKNGGSAGSELAVEKGLDWLTKVQSLDGAWRQDAGNGQPGQRDGSTHGITSLALLCYLGAGYTHEDESKHKKAIQKGFDWLVKNQNIGRVTSYEVGLVTMALCEGSAMTKDKLLLKPAKEGVTQSRKRLGSGGSAGYYGPGTDAHQTSFILMGLKSATLAKIKGPLGGVLERITRWYETRLQPDGTTSYGGGAGHEASVCTAVGLFVRKMAGIKNDPTSMKIAKVLDRVGPQLSSCYQVYDGTYAMFQVGGGSKNKKKHKAMWERWNKRFRDPIIREQVDKGIDEGSWNAQGGHGAARIVATCFNIMSLEVYYRFLPINK